MSNIRFSRSTREAFPTERFPAIEVYRAGFLARWARPLSWVITLGLFAAIGVMLAWRG